MSPAAGPIPILGTKLYAPRWSPGLVNRPRLVERVREGARTKLTLVSAPAGSGKTTLLADWLASRDAVDAPVGWVSLDDADNDAGLFWAALIRALQHVEPRIGESVLGELEVGAAPAARVLTALLNELAALDRELALVLDDYHVIATPAIHTALSFFLDHLPPRMHVVIASRTDPVLPLPRMRARGEVTEVRAADLRFTRDEAAEFFNDAMTLRLADADVAVLEQRTEGWIAGLKLAALSMRNHPDVDGFIRSFAGANRYVADYLIEEVLHAQPMPIRRFVLSTCVLERLTAPLCDAVTGQAGSQALLEELERSNLFVVALDDRRESYRYHHLFAEVVRAHAVARDIEEYRETHRRASLWHEQNGSIADAVRHASGADDVERVADLLGMHWPASDRSHASRAWLDRVRALPEAVVQARPRLDVGYAWALLNAGDLDAAGARLSALETRVDVGRDPDLARELTMARLYFAQSRGDIEGTVEHARQAIALVPAGDDAARATASALLALAHWARGDLGPAHDTFVTALASMRAAGHERDAIRGQFVLGDIRATQGRLREAARLYEAGLSAAAVHPQAETDELFLGLSEIHYERGDLGESLRLLERMDGSAARPAHLRNRHRLFIGLSRHAAARGDYTAALQLLIDAEAARRPDPLPVVRPTAAMKARLRIVQGDAVDADRWATSASIRDDDELTFLREYEHVTLARLYLAKNQYRRAADLLERLASAARSGGRAGSAIETLALRALAEHRLGNAVASMDAIAEALELAEPEGYLRVFVDEGDAMRDLLRHAAARGAGGSGTRRVLAGFREGADAVPAAADARAAAGGFAAAGAGAGAVLTARELEIVRLIAAGLRNQEIATQLFISPATVKRHIANAYNKLEATHRTDALRRAAELKLL